MLPVNRGALTNRWEVKVRNNIKLTQALWSDCETDAERADFLRSGRAVTTGIIALEIVHEVAMAFEFRAGIMKARQEKNNKAEQGQDHEISDNG